MKWRKFCSQVSGRGIRQTTSSLFSFKLHASPFQPFAGIAVSSLNSNSESFPSSSSLSESPSNFHHTSSLLPNPVSPVYPSGPSRLQNSQSPGPYIPSTSPLQSPSFTPIPALFSPYPISLSQHHSSHFTILHQIVLQSPPFLQVFWIPFSPSLQVLKF